MKAWLCLLVLFSWCCHEIHSIFHVLLGGTMLRRVSRRQEDATNKLDQFGDLPNLRAAIKAASQGASIAVFQTSQNCTVAALLSDLEQKLVVPIGAQPLKTLLPHMHLLLTGFAGDCRSLVRHARQLISNHTMDYGCAPSARYVANQLGQHVQQFLSGFSRALAVHAFLIHSPANQSSTIFEINSSGLVHRVVAGVAGKGGRAAHETLVRHVNTSQGTVEHGSTSRMLSEIWHSQLSAEEMGDRKVVRAFRLVERAQMLSPLDFQENEDETRTDDEANSSKPEARTSSEESVAPEGE